MSGLKVFDQNAQKLIEEKIFGETFLNWAYESTAGKFFSSSSFFQNIVSKTWGLYNHSKFSSSRIETFIQDYQINIEDYVVPQDGYASFSDFFFRKLKANKRNFPAETHLLGSPAEGRLSIFSVENGKGSLQIKGETQNLKSLLGDTALTPEFLDAWVFVLRLCPTDYHRFHFPDSGELKWTHKISGRLHSVHPKAQAQIPELFIKNERELSYFQSQNFGPLYLIEVGAFCVGLIKQTYTDQRFFTRGDEKGYFDFGASTCIVVAPKTSLKPNQEMLHRFSEEGIETLVQLGTPIATKI